MPCTAAPKQSVPHSGGVGGGAANDGRRWGSRARRARSRACGGCGAIRGCLGGARWQWRGTSSSYRPTRHFTPTSAWRRARPGQWRGNRRRWLSEMGCGSAHELHGTATTTWVRRKDVQRFTRWFRPLARPHMHAWTATHPRTPQLVYSWRAMHLARALVSSPAVCRLACVGEPACCSDHVAAAKGIRGKNLLTKAVID